VLDVNRVAVGAGGEVILFVGQEVVLVKGIEVDVDSDNTGDKLETFIDIGDVLSKMVDKVESESADVVDTAAGVVGVEEASAIVVNSAGD
jgi:hypothetical protein